MKIRVKQLLLLCGFCFLGSVLGCATIPTTKVYRQTEGKVSRTLYVLPVADETPQGNIDHRALVSLRTDLIHSLKSSEIFNSVLEADVVSEMEGVTFLQCRVSQYDISARRMTVATEILNGDSDVPFLRLVTNTEMISIMWPLDYFAVMQRAKSAIVSDISDEIIQLAENTDDAK